MDNKAKILVLNKSSKKLLDTIYVLFNPETYTITNKTDIHNKKSGNNNKGQAIQQDNRTLTFKLFYDTYSIGFKDAANQKIEDKDRDIRAQILKITDLINVPSSKNNLASKVCQFVWGSLIFTGTFSSATESYEMFLPNGIPVRGTLDVVMNEYYSKNFPRMEDEQTMELRKIDTSKIISHAANFEYGTPLEWREVAKKNGVQNPRNLN